MIGPSLPQSARVRVVNVVAGAGSLMGGVATWAARLPAAMATAAPHYEIVTLWVQLGGAAHAQAARAMAQTAQDHVCVIEPSWDHATRLRSLVDALESLTPRLIIANHSDIVFMAAGLARARGVRMIAAARSDEPYVRDLIRAYPHFDGAIGVSAACLAMLEDRCTRGQPLAMTPSGAPVSAEARTVSPAGPLRLAYVGRLAQVQKRIMDLPALLDALHARCVPFVMDVVGDGPQAGDLGTALDARPYRASVRLHGQRTPEEARAILGRADVAVLLSDYEGTSIAMLEAMGLGVVPVVTDVSGVRDWVRNGECGVVTPIGDTEAMADALNALCRDRARLASMGRCAWMAVRDRAGTEQMARVYADLFDRVLARSIDGTPTDCWLQPMEQGWWTTPWLGDHARAGDEADTFMRAMLTRCGYQAIANARPMPGCDAVLVGSTDAPPTPAELHAWRSRGLGVAVSPTLLVGTPVMTMRRAIMGLAARGCRRIALYGAGAHTRKVAAVARMGLPLVGVIDDAAAPGACWEGLPIVRASAAQATLRMDGVVLSSDTIEGRLWRASAPLRAMGVPVVGAYGRYEDAAMETVSA